MTNTRNRLYGFVLLLCALGFGWLAFHRMGVAAKSDVRFCFLKSATGFPCPACGTTRAVDALLSGHIVEAFYLNPFGLPVSMIMFAAPVWILSDFLVKSDSFYRFFQKAELKLNRSGIALPLIGLVLANWIWNYYKGY